MCERDKPFQNLQKPRVRQTITMFGEGLERPSLKNSPKRGSQLDLSQLLRKDFSDFGNEEFDTTGPYNFRQLLRPTKHLPTESLRKRKGFLPPESQTTFIHPGDSPSKKRAQKL